MKVAIYTIALNEEQFVEPWFNSAKDADYLLIADTGSTDKTIEKAKSLGINVISINIKPWRFEDARNASLAAIPLDVDYCIALDMDEVILPGWRKELEKAFENKWTRPRYEYTWNWNEDGTPGLQYGGDKIHSRFGYRWKHPVHEILIPYSNEETQGWTALNIHHHADNTKPRSQYLPLLAMSVKEDPEDDRNAFYYARELFYYGKLEEAAVEFKRHLALPRATWNVERSSSMRFLSKCDTDNAEHWLKMSINEAPGSREPLIDLSEYYYKKSKWDKSIEYADKALEIKEKPLIYLCESDSWTWKPHDLKAIALYNIGRYKEAEAEGKIALSFMPDNDRLKNNLEFYKKSL